MNYLEAMEYIEEISKTGSVPGLDSVTELLKRLENPQKNLQFIHIAGTNGKGSTLCFISAILQKAGLKVGRYSSPSVFSYNEKIQVNCEDIKDNEIAEILTEIKNVRDQMFNEKGLVATVFEVETAMAFLYFKRKKCDIVVLETGMGGLEDATNVVENTLISVITSISMDHMGFLGDTLEKIAFQKAGIIKSNSTVVTTLQEKSVKEVIRSIAKEKNSRMVIADYNKVKTVDFNEKNTIFSYEDIENIELNMLGTYQVENAVLAIEVINALNEITDKHSKDGTNSKIYGMKRITKDMIKEGLKSAMWRGRFYKISEDPLFFIDGAHNEKAALKLRNTLKIYFKDKEMIFIMGIFADKEYKKICELTCELASKVYVIETPNNVRALDAHILAEEVQKYVSDVEVMPEISEAVKSAEACAKMENKTIIAFGSLSYLAEIIRCEENIDI